jgi:hypothetical protein
MLEATKAEAELPIASFRIDIYSLKDGFAIFFHQPPCYLTQPLSHQRLKLPLQHCGLPVCSSRICRMEVGRGKMKKHQSIVARPSPALGFSL